MRAKGSSRGRITRALLIGCALAAPALVAGMARAEEASTDRQLAQATQPFSIEPQPLASALDRFADATGLSFAYRTSDVSGLSSPGVSGSYTAAEALQRLLAGTGVAFRFTGASTVTLTRGPREEGGATMLGPVVVEGGSGGAVRSGVDDTILIGREELELLAPQTMKEVFAGESAVSVGGAVPVAQKVYVNGVEETNLAVTIDGARQNNKVFHHNTTNLIDPGMLKAVRVDPGVAPADAGPAALGGAIVYETVDVADLLDPARSIGGFATVTYNTNGNVFTNSLSGYGRSAGFEALGYFKWGLGQDYEDGNGDTVPGTETDFLSGLAKGAYESPTGHRFELSAQRIHDDADRAYRANIGSIIGRPDPETRNYKLTNENYVFSYSTPGATGLLDPEILVAYSQSTVEVPDPFGSEGKTGGWSGKVENDFNLTPDDVITAGVDFYVDHAKYDDPVDSMREKASNVGFYGQARLRPLEPLSLSFGARGDQQWFEGVDGSEHSNFGLSGNVAAAYDVTDFLTLKAGYSNVWGGIALQETYIFNPAWTYDDIEPVRSRNYVAGFEAHHEGFTLDAGVFRSEFDNARDATYRGGPYLPVDFTSRGYNLGVGYTWGPGFVRLSYTDSKVEIDGTVADSDTLTYFAAPIGQVFALEAAHRFDEIGLTIGGTIDAALKNDDLVDQGYQELEPYKVVNLFAEYQPRMAEFLTLRLEVNNLFDEAYADRATYGQEFSTVTPLMEPGRSILLSATARF